MSKSSHPLAPYDPDIWRELSTRTVLFHQAVAEKLGLSQGDHKCLDLIAHPPDGDPMTPGRLAEVSGLTTGAITGVLDRLEQAGFVRREKDPDDRRQVFIAVLPSKMRELEKIFEPLGRATQELAAQFSERELERVTEFVKKGLAIIEAETDRLRQGTASSQGGPEVVAAPRGRLVEATFEARKGAWNFSTGVCDDPELYRADVEDAPWTIERSGGTVSVVPKKRGFLDLFRSAGRIARLDLNRNVSWAIHFRRGCAGIDIDARQLKLRDFELTGGVSKIAVRLPHPSGAVPIRLRGGSHEVRITRPRHTAVRLVVHGGLSGLTIDSMKLGSVGGVMRWESPEFEGAQDRFEIDLSGGTAGLTLEVG